MNGGVRGRWWMPVALVLVAVLLRGAYLVHTPRGMQFAHVNAQGYHWLAVNLLERGVFSMNTEPPYRADNVRAPLYPLFVAGWYAIDGPLPELIVLALVYMWVSWGNGPRSLPQRGRSNQALRKRATPSSALDAVVRQARALTSGRAFAIATV